MEFVFALGGIVAGWMVISAPNPVHSVLSLVLSFANLSILLLLLGLEFLPLLFLIVYVGAIAILFLFVIMMLNIKLVEILDNSSRYLPIGVFIGIIFIWEILITLNNNITVLPTLNAYSTFDNIVKTTNIQQLAELLYTQYFLHFWVGAMILLVAMIGAIVLTISHEETVKRQDLFAQISTKNDLSVYNVK